MKNIPDKIDQYEIKELIGAGTLAKVFRAYDPERQMDVAIKTLVGDQQETERERLRYAAAIQAKVDHPGLVKLLDIVVDDERAYCVQEFIQGGDLLDALDAQDGFLDEKLLLDWAVQVCEVLAHMHRSQPEPILHRAIKPANLLLDRDGRVRIIDLAIAASPGGSLEKLGTEGYSPPEQYHGRSDERSDVFSLGATLYHLATKRDPRQAEPFTFYKHPVREINSAISESFAGVIAKATCLIPDDRYQSIAAMQADLEKCRQGIEIVTDTADTYAGP
jgi:serine/threonine-protein kinase